MEDACEGKHFSFPAQEEKTLEFWPENNACQQLLERMKGHIFYDGPPSPTGLPHYGHILAGAIKDSVTRFQTMAGHHVTRRFSWDCHGLPVENEIDKLRENVVKMGIDKYNEECSSIVTRYCEEWEKIMGRTSRWIHFKNDYKTIDLVWWEFSQLYEGEVSR